MEAHIRDLRALFHQQVSYRIPQFQRPYAWGEGVQWIPLWDDIRNLASRVLSRQGDHKILPHFMGAIVLQQQRSNTGEVTKRLVVDGQQRLTTLQLLIKATEEVFQSRNDAVRASRLRELTINQESHCGGTPDNQTKIRQSNINDQRAFNEALRGTHAGGERQSWALKALNYFKEELSNWLDDTPENVTDRANALEEALTEHLKIAVIDLDQGEKPHVIFETLNARGEPLKQSDLIKNIVMYEANVIDDDEQANKLWGMFDDEWWQQYTKESRSLRTSHIDRFLRYWMVMRALKDVTANRVASEFRKYLGDTQSSIETVASEVIKAGFFYAVVEGGLGHPSPELKAFCKRMKAIELGVVTPVLLWLFTSEVPNDRRQRCIEILESYGVRRKLCGLQTQGLNKVFIGLLQALDRAGPDWGDTTILHFLKTQQADGSVWPNDRMLCDHVTINPMKGNASWKKMVLVAIELQFRSEKAEELGPTSNLEIEHVMPKAWQAYWPLSPGNSYQDEAESTRNEAIQKIGNLTLTTEKLNKSLSNGPWHEKRLTLANHSSLFLNKTLIDNAPDVWDEDAISERSKYLAETILRIWPSSDKFAESAA